MTEAGTSLQRRRIGVYGLVRDTASRLLLVPDGGGRWRLPGTTVRHSEDPFDALVRGVAAEIGQPVTPRAPVGVYLDMTTAGGVVEHHDIVVFDVSLAGTVSGEARWVEPEVLASVDLVPWTAQALGASAPAPCPPPPPPEPPGSGGRRQRFAAYGLVRDPAGRILLTRIAGGYPGAGTWHLPGGGTDFGEAATDALARELAEETGQHGAVGELLTVTHFHNPAAYGPERRPIDWHTVRTIFRVSVADPTPPIVHEHNGSTDAAGWFPLAEARALNLSALVRAVIEDYA